MNVRAIRWLAALALAGFVAVAALANLHAHHVFRILLKYPGIDKPIHFVEYAVVFLAMLVLSRALPARWRPAVAVVAVAAFAVSLTDEWVQSLFADRTTDLADLGANATGIVSATAGVAILAGRRRIGAALLAAGLVGIVALTWTAYRDQRHLKWAILLEGNREYAEARLHYLEAVRAGVATAGVYNSLAWVTVEAPGGDPTEALGYAERAIAGDPDNPDVLDTYGWVLVRLGRAAEGLPYLRRALAGDPGIYCVHYHLGEAYLALGDRDAARRHMTLQIEGFPEDADSVKARRVLERLDAGSGGDGPPGGSVP